MSVVSKSRLKKGDEVIVITGSDRGRQGRVKSVLREAGRETRVLVDGVCLVKKHIRANPHSQTPGRIKTIERPLSISNVAIYNSETKKADRVGFKRLANGKKIRVFKSDGSAIDKTVVSD